MLLIKKTELSWIFFFLIDIYCLIFKNLKEILVFIWSHFFCEELLKFFIIIILNWRQWYKKANYEYLINKTFNDFKHIAHRTRRIINLYRFLYRPIFPLLIISLKKSNKNASLIIIHQIDLNPVKHACRN
jgi:hypothetical protein